MKSFIHLGLAAAMIVAAGAAYAGPEAAKRTLGSYEQFLGACANPAQEQNQNEPEDISVECVDTQYNWVPGTNAAEGNGPFETVREFTLKLNSNKYVVNSQRDSNSAACPTYKQVKSTLSFTLEHQSCNDLRQYATAKDLCTAVMDAQRKNAKTIEQVDTGRTMNLCGSAAPAPAPAAAPAPRTPTGQR